MILSKDELAIYRGLVGLQVQYAQLGDSHKVMELQLELEKWIQGCAEVKIERAGGGRVVLSWSNEARAQYRSICADAMLKERDGFVAWANAQFKVERWVSDYIQQGVFQATIKI